MVRQRGRLAAQISRILQVPPIGAKTTGSANTTDDAEMAAGTSASGSAGTESKDSAEQEAAGAGTASGAAGNQAEKAAESATKTEEKNPASTADKGRDGFC